jgi:quinol monooxygenase YgiN
MIHSSIRVILPPKNRPEALGIFWSMVERTKFEPGCLNCCVSQDTKDERVIILEEWWNSEEELQRHLRSDGYRKVLLVMEMALQPPEVRFETISGSSGFETIQKARNSLL